MSELNKVNLTENVLVPIGVSLVVGAGADEDIIDRHYEKMGLALKTGVHIKTLGAELGAAKRLIVGGAFGTEVWSGACEAVDG